MPRRCSSLRGLLHRSRPLLSDAERLELEVHLEQCARCSADVALVDNVRTALDRLPSRPLGDARVARAIDRAFATAAEPDGGPVPEPRRAWLLVGGIALAAATAALIVGLRDDAAPTRGAAAPEPAASDRVLYGDVLAHGRALAPSAPIPSRAPLVAVADAVIGLADTRVKLAPHTEVSWDAGLQVLQLAAGRLELTVASSAERRVRVTTQAFIVEVAGARFEVTPDRVAVHHGVVWILDTTDGAMIAELGSDESWQVERLRPTVVSPPAAASSDVAPAAPEPPEAQAPRASAAELLSRARRALAAGDLRGARKAARAALASTPRRAEAAEASTLLAECALAAADPAEAIRAYLDVARRYPDLRAGETALFAAARLAANRGHIDQARALFLRYARAYPSGDFAAEARTRERALQPDARARASE
ncbi:MAG TPA: FecR domain-containing protein [Kofleriaceae bacterium]|nr:FecR domain-containing protein [Kofleriaceae bacterium]